MRPQTKLAAIWCTLILLVLSTSVFGQLQDDSAVPLHLSQARQLVTSLNGASENVYGDGKRHIDWTSTPAAARTVCASFVTLLLQHTYGMNASDFKSWMNTTNPEAADYHDAIVARNGFKRVLHITALRPGDIIAIKYTDHHLSSNGVEDTGHIMIVDDAPVQIDNKRPIVTGTQQYTVSVIDSSASGHGPMDSRASSDGKLMGGIGRGILRLYANTDDRIVGYTWSDLSKSPYFCGPNRDIVAGRLDRPEVSSESGG
jgi:hypothetical protein